MPDHEEKRGIGCGLFLVLMGLVLFARRAGWIPFGTDWVLPAALVAIGGGMVYNAISRR